MKREYWMTLIFILALTVFALVSTKILFHDTPEYITIAKNFAGVDNVDIFTTHSLLYPLMISPFLKIWPSLAMIKLINCLWIFLIGLVFLLWLKDKRAFIIFAFSPLVWYTSIQTTPVLPASFFMLLAYIFIKKEGSKLNIFYSGLFLGLACAVYDPAIFIGVLFVLVYFWNRKFYDLVIFSIGLGIGFLPSLALDYWLFHMPLYSLIRFFGTNAIISLGLSSSNQIFNFSILGILLMLVIISPLLFRIYKINFSENKKDLIFLGISFVFLVVREPIPKYFLLIAPMIILLLSKLFAEREIRWHCLLSLILVILLVWGYFGHNEDFNIQQELNNISNSYNASYIVAGPYEANNIAVFLWKSEPRVVWLEDLQASLGNKSSLKSYSFKLGYSKMLLREDIFFSADFRRSNNRTYTDYIVVAREEDKINGFALDKCYDVLCVYES